MVLGGALGPGFGACDAAALCVAGVAQPDIHLRFTWQAWHKLTSTVVLRGRRGTYGTGWRALGRDLAPVTPGCMQSARMVSLQADWIETVSGFSSTPFWSRTYLQTGS